MVDDFVRQKVDGADLVLVQEDKVPLGESHADGWRVLLVRWEEGRGVCRVGDERSGIDNAVAWLQVRRGGREGELAVVDAGACEVLSQKPFRVSRQVSTRTGEPRETLGQGQALIIRASMREEVQL